MPLPSTAQCCHTTPNSSRADFKSEKLLLARVKNLKAPLGIQLKPQLVAQHRAMEKGKDLGMLRS